MNVPYNSEEFSSESISIWSLFHLNISLQALYTRARVLNLTLYSKLMRILSLSTLINPFATGDTSVSD